MERQVLRTCPDCHGPLIKHGFLIKEHTQRYRCKRCVKTYSDADKRQFGVFRIKPEKIKQTLTLLTEGNGIRASARIVGIHRDTVLSILKFAGQRCENLLKRKLVNVTAEHIEADEIWTFVHKKQTKSINPENDFNWWGDYYTYLGLESKTKLLFVPYVGKRTETSTKNFMDGLAKSVTGQVQITTDGFRAYRSAVKEAFGNRVDFAQYYKEYNMLKGFKNRFISLSERHKWKDSYLAQANEKPYLVRAGNPDASLITTSRIERANLTLRTANKRFNRGTICFSRDEECLHYAVMLFVAHYNFVKPHSAIRKTPAMEAGITDRKWMIEEMLMLKNE
jgi:transposase-like protein/IS1 family transposase